MESLTMANFEMLILQKNANTISKFGAVYTFTLQYFYKIKKNAIMLSKPSTIHLLSNLAHKIGKIPNYLEKVHLLI